jgi:predicted transcriptional regulator
MEKNILLLVYEEQIVTSETVQDLLTNVSLAYASNLLKKLWGDELLSRKKINLTHGGFQYQYKITSKGIYEIKDIF